MKTFRLRTVANSAFMLAMQRLEDDLSRVEHSESRAKLADRIHEMESARKQIDDMIHGQLTEECRAIRRTNHHPESGQGEHPNPAEIAVGKILNDLHPEWGDLDGFYLQELFISSGIMEQIEVSEACGENCRCMEWGGDDGFPMLCIRWTDIGRWCLAAADTDQQEATHAE